MTTTHTVPLVQAVAALVPRNRWVSITYLEHALNAAGREPTRREIHDAAAHAAARNLIARRRRTNRTFQFRGQPFTWDQRK